MIQALFSVVIGVLLLGLLLYWALRESSSVSSAGFSAANGLKTLQLDFPATDLLERILDPRDLDFVHKESATETVKLFKRERRALAISWLQQTRREVSRLMSYHVAVVRENINLRPALEMKLALQYVRFLVTYELILGVFYIRDPFRVRQAIDYVTGATAQLCSVSEKLLSSVQFSAGVSVPPANTASGG